MQHPLASFTQSNLKEIAMSLSNIKRFFQADIAVLEEAISELLDLDSSLSLEKEKIESGGELAAQLGASCSEEELISWGKIPWRMNRLEHIAELKAELVSSLSRLEVHLNKNKKALSLFSAKANLIDELREIAVEKASEEERMSLLALASIARRLAVEPVSLEISQ